MKRWQIFLWYKEHSKVYVNEFTKKYQPEIKAAFRLTAKNIFFNSDSFFFLSPSKGGFTIEMISNRNVFLRRRICLAQDAADDKNIRR